MNPMTNRDRHARERGAIAAFAGIILMTLVGMTVVGVDLGRLAFTASEVQTIADAGANAYAKCWLIDGANPGACATPGARETKALEVVAGNLVDGSAAETANVSFTEGTWDYDTSTFGGPGAEGEQAVRADGTATVSNFFASLFGAPETTVEKSAIAAFSCPSGARPFPIAVGDCMFEDFQSSGDCSDLPRLFQQPRDNSCWTSFTSQGGNISDFLPPACCQGGNCGGGEPSPSIGVGTEIDLDNGQINVLNHIMEDCVELCLDDPSKCDALTKFVIPIVECNADLLNCSGSSTVVGFASIQIVDVLDQGKDKALVLSAFCNTDAAVEGSGGECLGTENVALVQ